VAKVLSTDDGRQAVEKILDDARSKVRSLLADNLVTVEALRDALLDRDELVGEEITAVIAESRQAPVSDQSVPDIIDLR
jgi:ATP-dependent Zn protease